MRAVVIVTLALSTTLALAPFQASNGAAPSAAKSWKEGQAFLKRKNYRAAADAFHKGLELDGNSINGHVLLAKARYELKEYKPAVQEYGKALELLSGSSAPDPELERRLHFDRAQAEHFGSMYDDAIADYTWLIDHGGQSDDLYMQRASSYDAAGKTSLAIADLTKAIELRASNSEIFLRRALLHKYQSNNELALKDFNDAIRLNPALATWRASFHRDNGQHTAAIADYTKAIEANKGCGRAAELCNRALVYADLDHHRKAITDLNAAIKLEPERPHYYANRGSSHFGVSDFKKSIADFSAAIKLSPTTADYWFKRAEAYTNDGQDDAALKDYDEAIRLQKDKEEAAVYHYRRALVAADLNRKDLAIDDLSQAVQLAPKNADYWFDRGLEYKAMDKFKEAESDFSKAVEIRTDFATAYKHRALARAKLGDATGALDDLKTSEQLYGKDNDMYGMAEVRRIIARLSTKP